MKKFLSLCFMAGLSVNAMAASTAKFYDMTQAGAKNAEVSTEEAKSLYGSFCNNPSDPSSSLMASPYFQGISDLHVRCSRLSRIAAQVTGCVGNATVSSTHSEKNIVVDESQEANCGVLKSYELDTDSLPSFF